MFARGRRAAGAGPGTDATARCYRVFIPPAGTARYATTASPGQAVALDRVPGVHLLVGIERDALETALARMLGHRPKRPLRFDTHVDLTSSAVQSWLAVVRLVQDDLEGEPAISSHPLAARSLQQLVMTGLLVAVKNSYSELLRDGHAGADHPARIRRAVQLIEDHAAEPLTVADIAEAVGVGVRALQQGFREHLGTTPMAYLRDVRLKRVRAELLAATPQSGASIAEIALAWGFPHLSRFAQAYKAMFGETPSTTLRSGWSVAITRRAQVP